MYCCPKTFRDCMSPIRIGHEVEGFSQIDESIYKQLRSLVVHVVVTGSMDDQQVALQAFRIIDRRSGFVTLRVVPGKAHVALLINRVVEALVRNRRYGHSYFI